MGVKEFSREETTFETETMGVKEFSREGTTFETETMGVKEFSRKKRHLRQKLWA
jgi:hypothetical protein